jgi:hypothetical protein
MSNIGLFAIGSVATLLVTASIALLRLGAILDGRDESQRQAAEPEASAKGVLESAAPPRAARLGAKLRAENGPTLATRLLDGLAQGSTDTSRPRLPRTIFA